MRNNKYQSQTLILFVLGTAILALGAAQFTEWKSGIIWPEPQMVDPGETGSAPSDATVLFDGTDMSAWQGGDQWEIKDDYVVSQGTSIVSKQEFGDIQLHLEWASPKVVTGAGQGRGNSGVYLMGRYEVQILDSYENPTYFDGQAAAIYKQAPPLVNATRKPGEWQTYDIIWRAPRFEADGTLKTPAAITVLHNGLVVQNHYELKGGTFYTRAPVYEPHPETGPIHLQFHGNPVRFRNIWVRELKPLEGKMPEETDAEKPAEVKSK